MTPSKYSILGAGTALLVALCPFSAAQVPIGPGPVFTEIEPNGYADANVITPCITAGNSITGTTTGASITTGDAALTSADFFKMKTCPLPLAIYRHKLTLTSAVVGQTGETELTNQTGTGCGTSAVAGAGLYHLNMLQNLEARWDAFGKQEQWYFNTRGSPGTTSPYTFTMSTTTITPTVIGPFSGGNITFTTVGQTGATQTDTSIAVYDSTLTLISTNQNEDVCPAGGFGSTLTRSYAAGTYFLAVSTWPMVTNGLAPNDDNGPVNVQYLAFFPDALFSTGVAADVSFTATDSAGTTPVAAVKNFFYDTKWFRFTVSTVSPGTVFCVPGTVTPAVIACPCLNPGGAGKGCANNGPADNGTSGVGGGGSLSSSGVADLSMDATDPGSMSLTGTGMYAGTACIFAMGPIIVGGGSIAFGAGVRCIGGALVRLYVKTGANFAGGTATAPQATDRSISNRTLDLGAAPIVPGTYYFQTYYRDPNIVAPFVTPGNPGCPLNFTFNMTSGQQVVWVP